MIARVDEDYRTLADLGIRGAREVMRWPLIDLGGGHYDFSSPSNRSCGRPRDMALR